MSTSWDRAAHLRKQPQAMSDRLASDDAGIVPLWRNRVVLRDGKAEVIERAAASELLAQGRPPVFLGLLHQRPLFAVDIPGEIDFAALLPADATIGDLRMVGATLSAEELEVLSMARGMLLWHRRNGFCGSCGAASEPQEAGHARRCSNCDKKTFPRTDPAIMALVIHRGATRAEDRCVLARQAKFAPGMFSLLAGFVEPGESVEAAVAREVHEEVGVTAVAMRYVRSQAWPFPASLMLGYVVETNDDELCVDKDEIDEARWVTRDQLRNPEGFFVPPPYSLSHYLISGFRDDAY